MNFKKDLESLKGIDNPSRKRILFSGLLSQAVIESGYPAPIIVGGEAVEIYTNGQYTTGDIDIKGNFASISSLLEDAGFHRNHGVFYHPDLDIAIDWLGGTLEQGQEAENKAVNIKVNEDLYIRVISVEDLIIDRLCAAKFWDDKESEQWARILWEVKSDLDIEYLKKRALQEDVEDIAKELFDISIDTPRPR